MRREIVYLEFDEACNLVDRISDRIKELGGSMSENEKEAMSSLLSDCGIKVSDLICVKNLADNYRFNAAIVTPDEVYQYDNIEEDSLFFWEDSGDIFYCYSW